MKLDSTARALTRVEHTACVVCAADDARAYKRGMYAIGEQPFDLVRCRDCGFVYVDPRPDGESLARLYEDPDYYTEGYNLGVETENYFERRAELLEMYDATVEQIERERLGQRGALFELGSAGGFLLEAARRRGWTVRGVEVSPVAAQYSRREFGLDVFEGLLADAPLESGSFDVAIADNVLEHTTDPGEVLRQLLATLRPGGSLIVIVPSYVNSIFFRALIAIGALVPRSLIGEQLASLLKLNANAGHPYHILEFHRASLIRLLRSSGYEIVSVEGSVPLPAHLFKQGGAGLRARCLRTVFRTLDKLMRMGWVPAARLRIVAQRPSA